MNGDVTGEEAIQKLTLAEFNTKFDTKGSIACGGKLRVLNQDQEIREERIDRDMDFCVLTLHRADNEQELMGMGLSWLECGDGDYLDPRKGEVVSIYGHPEIQEEPTRPLRLSYGKEKESSTADSLIFDYDSLEGSSGSPVVGRGSISGTNYAVKGIHVGSVGNRRSKKNRAQGLKKIIDPDHGFI